MFTYCFGLLVACAVCFGVFGSIQPLQFVHAQTTSMSTSVTIEHQVIPPAICARIKKDAPGHNSDSRACDITITHTIVAPSALLHNLDNTTMALKPGAITSSCGPNGATATAYDDLSYSYLWTEELYTKFVYNGWGCQPTLIRIAGYVKYAIAGLTSLSQSTQSYNSGNTMIHGVENIVSTNGLFGFGAQFSSCQSRSFDGYGHWPYYSNLYAQDC